MATQEQLDEAQAALHALRIGKQVVSIQKNGRKVDFSQADSDKLSAYIYQLKCELSFAGRRRFARVSL